ncbi:hydrogenase maturation protease [Streptomyces sp. NPDC058595]|uniref:hydrogenase maturation protease n=1 Tax=Streptomyces sp. NPDC058595 TaxID=3346550 RepID=UPI003649CC79
MTGRVVVIGVGNSFRRDDGAGPAVVEAVRFRVPDGTQLAASDGEPGRMISLWNRHDHVVIVEVVHARPSRPGRLHHVSAERVAGLAGRRGSTHALGLAETVALATVLDRMPCSLVVHAVEGGDFTFGTGLSAPVAAALPRLIHRVTRTACDAHLLLRNRSR